MTEEREQPLLLVVDDQEDMAALIAHRLGSSGYEVVTAHDGREGLELARELSPDLVILDVFMPVMDGFAMCRELRQGEDTKMIPVIMLTAKGDIESRLNGMAAGANDFLDKTVDFRELVSRVRSFLETQQKYRDLIEAEKLGTLRQAATSVCHEINNPLAMISMKAELILMKIEGGEEPDPEIVRGLELILQQVDRIGQITSKLAQAVRVVSTRAYGSTSMIDVDRSTGEEQRQESDDQNEAVASSTES